MKKLIILILISFKAAYPAAPALQDMQVAPNMQRIPRIGYMCPRVENQPVLAAGGACLCMHLAFGYPCVPSIGVGAVVGGLYAGYCEPGDHPAPQITDFINLR